MFINIGISGFGRIGKLVFRIIEDLRINNKENIRVVGINCPSITSENMKYLINYDSVHNFNKYKIQVFDNYLIINDNKIRLFRERNPSNIKWDKANVNYVIDSTGVFTCKDGASKHFNSEVVKKVIVTAPCSDIPMYVVGVNTDNYNNEKIVSNASCTTNCLAPIAKVINDYVGIEEGFVSTIHSITSSQNTLDSRASKNIRIGRSCNNIIPSTTGATKALGVVIPELSGKISGLSFRVPTPNVSILDFSFKTRKKTNYEELIERIKYESENSMKGIINFSYEELVSTDYIGNKNSCIIDINLGKQIGDNFFKIVAWYDNEYGYSNRVVDLLKIIVN